MARAIFVLACVALLAGQAAAQLALCNSNGVPGSPKNVKASGRYDSGKKVGVITVTWDNPTGENPALGCTNAYKIKVCNTQTNACTTTTQNRQGSPIQTAQKAEMAQKPAGATYRVTVQAVGNANKVSPEISAPSQAAVPSPAPCLGSAACPPSLLV